jgi:flagellar biosynthetic protein FlhB
MAEDQDQSQKTEEPTERKLKEAREKGQVVKSQEVTTWFMLFAGTLAVTFIAPYVMGSVRNALYPLIAMPHALATDPAGLGRVLYRVVTSVAAPVGIPIALFVFAALAGNLVQTGLLFAPEGMKPDPSKLSLIKGFKRVVSLRSLVEFGKGVAKLALVAAVAATILIAIIGAPARFAAMDVQALLNGMYFLIVSMLAGVLSILAAIAALDWSYQRYEFRKQMRMTKQEVKDENKQAEGDPQVKAKLRAIRAERARRRMMAAVPQADVVITNPTHYAVALRYDAETMAAPVLVAKGTDALAQRIRTVAEAHAIPVVENPPLARALHAGVELGEEVPPRHYRAVAEIIGYVMRLRRQGPGAATPGPAAPGPSAGGGPATVRGLTP